MHIVITGGAGFLGTALAEGLLQQGMLGKREIGRITLLDRTPVASELLLNDPRVECLTGDLIELIEARRAVPDDCDAMVHLAAAVSAECEADFDLGMRSNIDATRALLEACRTQQTKPMFLFASSVAVFGGILPDTVSDDTLPCPQSSYGIQKFIGEQFVADYSRKGFVDGRSVRLMTVSVRPGKPNGAASGFLSGMIREPLAGLPARCPVPRETAVALSSPARSIEGLIRALEVPSDDWGPRTAVNMPALSTTVGEMAAALTLIGGAAASDLIDWQPDTAIERMIGSWPAKFNAERAAGLGLVPDYSFEEIIRAYVAANPSAVTNQQALAG
jgi:D-erythronate 2-dehydrogenase